MSLNWFDLIPPGASGLLADPQIRIALVLLVAAGAFSLLGRGKSKREDRREDRRDDDDVRRPNNTPWLRRQWWKVRKPHDLMKVDGLQIERTGKRSHALWLGPTGEGKSASVATVRVDGARPTLIVTPDLSDPMIESCARLGGFRWQACVGPVAVDFLIGEPTEVAERLTEVFRSGGVGAWKRTARMTTAEIIRSIDISGRPRSLKLIGELLKEAIAEDRELKMVCQGWVSRFLDLADQFGTSIGAGGEDIAELLNDGQTVVLDNDAFAHASLGGDVVALGLAEAKRCATLVPGGFRLIFEEAGQLGDRIDLADPFFRAGRRRKIAVDALTQAESDLDDAITQNSGTRVYFTQELKSLQKTAADRLGFDYRELDSSRMQEFTAWVSSKGIRRLVKFPKPLKAPSTLPSVTDGLMEKERMEETDGRKRTGARGALKVGREELLALPPPSTGMQKLLVNIYPEAGCERWGGKHDKDGYGLVWLDGRWQKVHRVRWELAYGPIKMNPDGTRLTIDHVKGLCAYKDCSKLVHLELVTRSINSKRRWPTRGVATVNTRVSTATGATVTEQTR